MQYPPPARVPQLAENSGTSLAENRVSTSVGRCPASIKRDLRDTNEPTLTRHSRSQLCDALRKSWHAQANGRGQLAQLPLWQLCQHSALRMATQDCNRLRHGDLLSNKSPECIKKGALTQPAVAQHVLGNEKAVVEELQSGVYYCKSHTTMISSPRGTLTQRCRSTCWGTLSLSLSLSHTQPSSTGANWGSSLSLSLSLTHILSLSHTHIAARSGERPGGREGSAAGARRPRTAPLVLPEGRSQIPPSSEYGTYTTVKARFWPWRQKDTNQIPRALD